MALQVFFYFLDFGHVTYLRIYDLQIYNVLNEMDICRKIETLYTPELGYAIFHRGHLDQFDGTNLCTLEYLIIVGVRLLIFWQFSSHYALIPYPTFINFGRNVHPIWLFHPLRLLYI